MALELDSLKLELEKLKAENARLRAKDSTEDGLREEQESYEQVVGDLLLKDQEIADLNDKLEAVSSERDTAVLEVSRVKEAAELKLHRRLEQERNKWEAREERWAKQLASVERQVGLSGASCDTVQLPEHFSPKEGSPHASPVSVVVTPTTPCSSIDASSSVYSPPTDTVGTSTVLTSPSADVMNYTTTVSATSDLPSLISSTSTAATTYIAPTSGLATLPAISDVPSDVHPPGAWMTQQLPPLNKFSGDGDSSGETIEEWLEQFELVAAVARWDQSAKLANLVTRLKGPAFAFFRSCPIDQRRSYHILITELKKRFTPVHIGAVQTSLFHDRKQLDSETVDTYAQDLRGLFHKAYPSSKRGTHEAERIAQIVLTNQFVAGLRTSLKAKVAGTEGSFEELLTKARFEEAKLRELKDAQLKQSLTSSNRASAQVHPTSRYSPASGQKTRREQPPRFNGPRQNPRKCYNCGSASHLANQCPHRDKSGPAEAPGRERSQTRGSQVAHISGDLATVTPVEMPKETAAELRQKLKEAEVREAISDVFVTLHGLETGTNSEGVKLGPTPKAQIILEGEATTALLDTGSPVTIVSLEHLLRILARTRPPETTPEQWRAKVEDRLKPTSLNLRNYGGDELNIVRQISVSLTHGEHSVTATIQVQAAAPAPLLIGTDVLPQLGFQSLSKDHNEYKDLLQAVLSA